MASTNEIAWELNEVGWWANWADVMWPTRESYLILSDRFDEYFFNRGGFVVVTKEAEEGVSLMESEFKKRGLTPHIFIQNAENRFTLLHFLVRKGYVAADQMSVMEAGRSSFATNAGVRVTRAGISDMDEWAKVYLAAFYGKQTLFSAVRKIVGGAEARKEVTFLLARVGEKAAGGLAMFRSEGVCGVYCVGTHPDFRKMRVASTMLEAARKIASGEGRRLILQTIASDSAEPLYLKLGFRRAYVKELFVKRKVAR